MIDITAATLGSPPPRFRYHGICLTVFAAFAIALSCLIWLFVPNEGRGPQFGLEGLRDLLLLVVWGTFALFAAASTAALALIPAGWQIALRLVLAYLFGLAFLIGLAALLIAVYS